MKTLQAIALGVSLLSAGCVLAESPGPDNPAPASTAPASPAPASPAPRAIGSAADNGHRAGGAGAGNLSLADAVAMGLRRNIDLKVESLFSSQSEEDVKRSRAIYDPFLNASASGGGSTLADRSGVSRTGNASVGVTQLLPTGASVTASTQTGYFTAFERQPGTPDYSYSSSVSVFVRQPLLENAGKRMTEVNIVLAKNALRDSLDRYRFFAADTVLAVITSYNRLYALRQSLDSRKTSLDVARTFLDATKARAKEGTLQRLELMNAEFGVVQRLRDVVDGERNVRDQEASLRYLIGLTEKQEIIPTDPPTREEPEQSEEQAVKTALELRADLKQLRTALESSRLQKRVAKNQTLPDVSLFAEGRLYGNGGTVGDNVRQAGDGQGNWSAGLNLTMPLGNTAAESDYRKSKIREEQARTQIRALSWRIRNDVESDLRALISARVQIRVAEKSLEQANERLEEYRKSYQSGGATAQNVLDAEADLSFARSSRIDALETYADTVTRLWRDTGELLDRMGVKINASKPEKWTGGDEG